MSRVVIIRTYSFLLFRIGGSNQKTEDARTTQKSFLQILRSSFEFVRTRFTRSKQLLRNSELLRNTQLPGTYDTYIWFEAKNREIIASKHKIAWQENNCLKNVPVSNIITPQNIKKQQNYSTTCIQLLLRTTSYYREVNYRPNVAQGVFFVCVASPNCCSDPSTPYREERSTVRETSQRQSSRSSFGKKKKKKKKVTGTERSTTRDLPLCIGHSRRTKQQLKNSNTNN